MNEQNHHNICYNCQNCAPLAVSKFTARVTDVYDWLRASRIQLNASKTNLMWLDSTQLLQRIIIMCNEVLMLGTLVVISEQAHNLGMVIDCEMSLAVHITVTLMLWPTSTTYSTLCVHAIRSMVQPFISCILNYCDSLLYGINNCSRCRMLCCIQSLVTVGMTMLQHC